MRPWYWGIAAKVWTRQSKIDEYFSPNEWHYRWWISNNIILYNNVLNTQINGSLSCSCTICVCVCVFVCVYHINSDILWIHKFTKFGHLCKLGGFQFNQRWPAGVTVYGICVFCRKRGAGEGANACVRKYMWGKHFTCGYAFTCDCV